MRQCTFIMRRSTKTPSNLSVADSNSIQFVVRLPVVLYIGEKELPVGTVHQYNHTLLSPAQFISAAFRNLTADNNFSILSLIDARNSPIHFFPSLIPNKLMYISSRLLYAYPNGSSHSICRVESSSAEPGNEEHGTKLYKLYS